MKLEKDVRNVDIPRNPIEFFLPLGVVEDAGKTVNSIAFPRVNINMLWRHEEPITNMPLRSSLVYRPL